ncbi:STAS domain-containing protein [Inhella gelatinilytica]|uniref:STAS domain-containing protein n=1 Tax=Inhella gelatinilytica TaxID=2795030 RepID=A0A931IUL0_9BURK|nr:STAS domain-containing protein [Inhella gelatinilytica]MBH9552444.1 STAS domain-containing protein [Inhella gelatinilytica]
MPNSSLRLPASMVLGQAAALARQWESCLAAEAAGVTAAAGTDVRLSAADLQSFDSSALSVLLGCARVCTQHGLVLRIEDAPPLLRQLARMYGVEELLWVEPAPR